MPGPELVVDGYNVLLALARREGIRQIGRELPRLRSILHDLLSEWSRACGRAVTVAWDGAGSAPAEPPPGVRVVFVEPPAEADDWIARYAEQRTRAGETLDVVTRDRGLRARLPAGIATTSFQRLADDLRALRADPLRAPRVGGGARPLDELPASDGPVDTSRLPRRRSPRHAPADDPRPAPGRRAPAARPERTAHEPAGARPAAGEPPAEDAARAAARARREARRRRWERASRRRARRRGRGKNGS